MKSDRRAPVAIIGGGFSGTMLAAQLARQGIRSVLIESGEKRAGRGTAYSAREPAHLLNVRAEAMSAWPDEPQHFARAFARAGGDPRGFAERRLFGCYVRQILDESIGEEQVELIERRAVSAHPDGHGWSIAFDDGRTIQASALALAIGNQEPELLRVAALAGARFINNPWGDAAQAAVARLAESGGNALLIGTGLTMVDLVLSLDAAGHRGRIVALSRRGLIPRGHAEFTSAPVERHDVPQTGLTALLRWLRGRGADVGWRAAVDSLRPHSHALWQGLSLTDQRRFLRHARPWWDVHRHRIAPEIAARIAELVAEDRLEVVAGRIAELREQGGSVVIEVRRRGSETTTSETCDYAFNCTGPLGAIERTRDGLLRGLLDRGLIRADDLGMGLDVDERSRAVGARRLWALGPLTKGRYWEIVAVPDIREQAAAVAEDIVMELGR